MIRYAFYLAVFMVFGCKNSTSFDKKTEQEEVDVFFENFIKIKKNDYDFKKIKYISYGDSLAFKYWIEESRVDTIYLKKYFDSKGVFLKNSISHERPIVFNSYKVFDFEDFYKYKRKKPNSNFNEYFSMNFNKRELMSINFLVFNEKKDRVIIYYSLDYGYVEVYSKKNNAWFLLKEISQITP